ERPYPGDNRPPEYLERVEDFTVEGVTLDGLLQKHGRPGLLKIDVEGAEILALRGATRLLADARPRLLMELHGQGRAREVEAILRSAKYNLSTLDGGLVSFDINDIYQVLARPQ